MISKGITLSYGETAEKLTALTDLQEIPDLGGDTESVEITTLADEAHMYENGLKNYGDSLPFKFLYKKEQFTTLNDLKGAKVWQVALPDGAKCTFSGESSVKLAGVGNNAALTYTLSVKPSTAMVWS